MKISTTAYVLISFFFIHVISHGSDQHSHHDHDHSSNQIGGHNHAHLNNDHHDHHDHQHHSKENSHAHSDPTLNKESLHKQGSIEHFLSHHIAGISQDKNLMMILAVVIVSLPSFPTFIVLLLVSKFTSRKVGKDLVLNEKYLRMMICLAVGSLTGDVFFGMMSHIIGSSPHQHEHSHDENSHGHSHEFKPEIFCIIVGIFFFYAVDRRLGGHAHGHSHDHSHDHTHNHENQSVDASKSNLSSGVSKGSESEVRNRNESKQIKSKDQQEQKEYDNDPQNKEKKTNSPSAILYLVADFLHNAIDGIGIGVAFSINNSLGIQTTIAVAIHELPHEIGDFAILLKKGYSLTSILFTQFLTALGALVGGFLGIYFGNFAQDYLLGFTAGGFLYLALGNMIPELLQSSSKAAFSEIILEVTLGMIGASLIIISA